MTEQPSHPRGDRPSNDEQYDDATVRVRKQVANDLGPEDAFGNDESSDLDGDA